MALASKRSPLCTKKQTICTHAGTACGLHSGTMDWQSGNVDSAPHWQLVCKQQLGKDQIRFIQGMLHAFTVQLHFTHDGQIGYCLLSPSFLWSACLLGSPLAPHSSGGNSTLQSDPR